MFQHVLVLIIEICIYWYKSQNYTCEHFQCQRISFLTSPFGIQHRFLLSLFLHACQMWKIHKRKDTPGQFTSIIVFVSDLYLEYLAFHICIQSKLESFKKMVEELSIIVSINSLAFFQALKRMKPRGIPCLFSFIASRIPNKTCDDKNPNMRSIRTCFW